MTEKEVTNMTVLNRLKRIPWWGWLLGIAVVCYAIFQKLDPGKRFAQERK